jgi:hypothetical protein
MPKTTFAGLGRAKKSPKLWENRRLLLLALRGLEFNCRNPFHSRNKQMNLYTSFLVSLCTIASVTSAVAEDIADAPETTIVVIESMEPGQTFSVTAAEQVRIPATAIAGTTISAEVDGPAKIVAHNRIVPMKENTGANGAKTLAPLIGMTEHEYLLQPTGPGSVTVTLTSRSPIPGIETQEKTYHFTVE